MDDRDEKEMKCRRHPLEDGDGDGVCASCLRERLLVLVASRAETSLQLYSRSSSESHPHPNNSDPAPPSPPEASAEEPFPLPRLPTPDISSISDISTVSSAASRMPQRFRDPQAVKHGATSSFVDSRTSFHEKSSILSIIFGHSRVRDHDPGVPKSSLTLGSWLSSILKSGKKKKKSKEVARLYSSDDATAAAEGRRRKKKFRKNNQGLSHEGGLSAPESGYATESPLSRRMFSPSPMRRTTPERHNLGRGLAGLTMCFSPLAMSSSIRRKCQVAEGFSGDSHRPESPQVQRHESGGGGSGDFGPSCSRKMADSGKLR